MCIFNYFYVIRLEIYRIRWNYAPARAITPLKVILGHQVWYQLKLIYDFLSFYVAPFPRYSVRQLQIRYIRLPLLCLTPQTKGFPWDDLRQILPGCQQSATRWHLLMGRPCGARKTSKIAHQIFKKKRIFKICALSHRPQGRHRKSFTWVHTAQLHFFQYTKS